MTLLVDKAAAQRLKREGWHLVRKLGGRYLMRKP